MTRMTRGLGVALLVVALAWLAGSVCSAQRLTSEPVNPAWVRYMNAARAHAVRTVTPDGHGLGYIPPPFLHVGAARTRPRGLPRLALPSSYDLRTTPGKVPAIRDQGACGSCWAFGTYASLETNLRPGDTFDGSENHLNNTHGFDWAPCEGGNYWISSAYLGRWSGPISEANDPYNPGGSSPPGLPPEKHVQEALYLPERGSPTDNDIAKQAIMEHGAVSVSYYHTNSAYNASTYGYYYNGGSSNHAVAAVGWDDNFAASNFSTTPPGNGAFLIRNSWGTSWGNGGYFWISYYDTSLGGFWLFNNAEPTTNYTTQYSYDPFGWVTSLGVGGQTTLYYANVFQKGADAERLYAVATYASAAGTPYQLEIYRDPVGGPESSSLARLRARMFPIAGFNAKRGSRPRDGAPVHTQTGTFTFAGYHTVVLSTPVELQPADTSFSVVFRSTNTSDMYIIPVEYQALGYCSAASASAGQSYVAWPGQSWADLTAAWDSSANNCIKAFTSPAPAGYRPDAEVRNPDPDTYIGNGIYNTDGTNQTKSQKTNQGVKAVYAIRVGNDGGNPDDYVIKGTGASGGWTVEYFDALTGGSNKTAEVIGTGWTVVGVAQGGSFEFRAEATPGAGVAPGGQLPLLISATSVNDGTKSDTVKAVTTKTTLRPDALIRLPSETDYTGDNIYNGDGTNQSKSQTAVGGVAAVFPFKVQNDGDPDTLNVTGPGNSAGWTVTYFDALSGGNDVTAEVTGAGKQTGLMPTGDVREWRVEITPDAGLASGSKLDVPVTVTSTTETAKLDVVKATANYVNFDTDLLVKNSSEPAASYVGNGVHNADGTDQTKEQYVALGTAAVFHLKLENDGDTDDSFTVTGPAGGLGWQVRYFDALTGGTEKTGDITGTGWATGTVAHGAAKEFRAEVTGTGLAAGDAKELLVKAVSAGNATKLDAVKAVTTIVGPAGAPVLAWAGTAGYETDGVQPDKGAANAEFTFQVKLTDSDADEPTLVRLVLTRNGAAYGTLDMAAGEQASTSTMTGRIYQVKKKLPMGNYTYRFTAADHDGAATGTPTKAKCGPIPPTAPMLVWDGSAGFKTDGLDPHTGRENYTIFKFKVKYYAYDGDRPTCAKVTLKKSGRAYRTFNLGVQRGTSPATGLTYGMSTKLPAGTYTYAFQFKDKHGAATGAPTTSKPGPTVKGGRASVVSALAAVGTRAGGAQVTFNLNDAATVTAEVLNLAGRPVATLARDRELEAGAQTLLWSGRSDAGPAVPNGVYLLRLEAQSPDGSVARHVAAVSVAR